MPTRKCKATLFPTQIIGTTEDLEKCRNCLIQLNEQIKQTGRALEAAWGPGTEYLGENSRTIVCSRLVQATREHITSLSIFDKLLQKTITEQVMQWVQPVMSEVALALALV